uniref:Large ribosomal subunit protein bL21c n=1 Tax=Dictyopteris divaricata TaxID=156996 RepID=A0A2I4Q2A5_9PHAE|nr:50S ribosomal protein L21 [Dictyopteris divaricata]YP_009455825.1 50S ribosomal protein L21 [Dictyopteris divaricata]YP_010205253.1 50S ribosomal protein L21 [Grateloupia livida]YP_010205330.1 50S ribosomal protein L21 [Grateloupia livida]AQZ24964.1 50S ribosomal protein L21 [Dictyopteris divaricata]AQZ25041.1 50S ribosomal protein L21 [Dictyopteris divaricata]UAV85822.1 50S ribosomal protein L21 [Grateloupia livida]UAV85899.1 50S ribosomal protein L21 [Grateloupia livida]
MEYAIIEASGRQFWIEPKKFVEFNRLLLHIGSTIILKRILFVKKTIVKDVEVPSTSLIKRIKKTTTFVGQPYITNIFIKGIISKHFLGPKILVFKMKPKKKYRKKFGHRQKLTRLFISEITESKE